MNEVLKVLKERRSIRAFRPEPLKKEDLDAIVEAGLYAPSAKNLQSTMLVAVQDADTIGQAAVRASIQANADRLRLNARLIRLRGGGALPFDIGELAYQDSGMTTNEVLAGIGLK